MSITMGALPCRGRRCDGISAQHAFHAPEGRNQAGGVGHGPADQVAFQSLEDVVAGDPEMICVSNADPAGPGLFGHLHGNAIRLGADHQAQSVVAIDVAVLSVDRTVAILGFGLMWLR